MIRKARPDDVIKIIPLVVEALRIDRYPSLLLSEDRIRDMAISCISSSQHFAWVSEYNGVLMGAVAAQSVPGFWFERSEANVVMFYCKTPGEGIAMMRELIRWFKSRPALKRLTFVCEFDADPRIMKLIERLGLNKSFPVYTMLS